MDVIKLNFIVSQKLMSESAHKFVALRCHIQKRSYHGRNKLTLVDCNTVCKVITARHLGMARLKIFNKVCRESGLFTLACLLVVVINSLFLVVWLKSCCH